MESIRSDLVLGDMCPVDHLQDLELDTPADGSRIWKLLSSSFCHQKSNEKTGFNSVGGKTCSLENTETKMSLYPKVFILGSEHM